MSPIRDKIGGNEGSDVQMSLSGTTKGPASEALDGPAALAMPAELCDRLTAALPSLQRFARSLAKDRDEAADLVQETCLRAVACWHQWQFGTRFESWLFQITRNLWIDRLRARQTRERHSAAVSRLSAPYVDGQRLAETRLTLRSIKEAVGRLPEEQREVLMRVAVGGESYKTASASLAIPIGTIMSRLSRARRAIHAEFGGALAKSLLLALLVPLLDREARAELAREPAPDILRKALTTLSNELGGNGPSRAEMAAALLVILLLDHALADEAGTDRFDDLLASAAGQYSPSAGSLPAWSGETSAEDGDFAARADRGGSLAQGGLAAEASFPAGFETLQDLAASAFGHQQDAALEPTASARQSPSNSARFADRFGSAEPSSEFVTPASADENSDQRLEEAGEVEELVVALFAEALLEVSPFEVAATPSRAAEQDVAATLSIAAAAPNANHETEPVTQGQPSVDLSAIRTDDAIPPADSLEPDLAPVHGNNDPAVAYPGNGTPPTDLAEPVPGPADPPVIALGDLIEPSGDPGSLTEVTVPVQTGSSTPPNAASWDHSGVVAAAESDPLDQQIGNDVQSDVS